MNQELNEERASLYALGLLEGEEARAFEQQLAGDASLRELVAGLQSAASALPCGLEPVQPRPGLKNELFEKLGQPLASPAPFTERARATPSVLWMVAASGWAAAACVLFTYLPISSTVETLRQQNAEFESTLHKQERELAEKRLEIEVLNDKIAQVLRRDPLDKRRLIRLGPQNDATPAGMVLWDDAKQAGQLVLDKLPPAAPDKDYQLWIIDPTQKAAIDCGVFAGGATTITFNPKAKVTQIGKFAVTLEKKGGVPVSEGTLVLIGG